MTYSTLLRAAPRASRLLKAIGNERRLVILCYLSEREHSVTDLCRLVGLSQSALSQHLAKLRRENLVRTRRAAQTVFYSVASPEIPPLLLSLSHLFGASNVRLPDDTKTITGDRPSAAAPKAGTPATWRK